VQNYDLVAPMAMDPRYRLDIMAAADRPNTTTIQAHAKADYSGRRVDFMDRDLVIIAALEALPDDVAQRQWFDLIFKHPALYLRVRWEAFAGLFATPVIDWCLPVYRASTPQRRRWEP